MYRSLAIGGVLAALWSAAGWAGSLDPAAAAIHEDHVTAAVMHRPSEGAGPAAMDFVVVFDPNQLRYQEASLGDAGQAAGKELYARLNEPGRLRVVIRGYNDGTIGAGEVARMSFLRTARTAVTTALQVTGVAMAAADGGRVAASGGNTSFELPERAPEEDPPTSSDDPERTPFEEDPAPGRSEEAASGDPAAGVDRSRLLAALALARRVRAELAGDTPPEAKENGEGEAHTADEQAPAEAQSHPVAPAPALDPYSMPTAFQPPEERSAADRPELPQRPGDAPSPIDRRAALLLFAGLGLLAVLILTRRWFFAAQ